MTGECVEIPPPPAQVEGDAEIHVLTLPSQPFHTTAVTGRTVADIIKFFVEGLYKNIPAFLLGFPDKS